MSVSTFRRAMSTITPNVMHLAKGHSVSPSVGKLNAYQVQARCNHSMTAQSSQTSDKSNDIWAEVAALRKQVEAMEKVHASNERKADSVKGLDRLALVGAVVALAGLIIDSKKDLKEDIKDIRGELRDVKVEIKRVEASLENNLEVLSNMKDFDSAAKKVQERRRILKPN